MVTSEKRLEKIAQKILLIRDSEYEVKPDPDMFFELFHLHKSCEVLVSLVGDPNIEKMIDALEKVIPQAEKRIKDQLKNGQRWLKRRSSENRPLSDEEYLLGMTNLLLEWKATEEGENLFDRVIEKHFPEIFLY